MKKTVFTSILMLFMVFSFAGKIEKTYYFETPKIQQVGEYQLIKFDNTMNTGMVGQPSLPYQAISLLVPPGEIATSFEIIAEGETQLDGNFNIHPYQPSQPLSVDKKASFQKNEAVYQSDAVIPASLNGKLSTSFMNGYGFAFSSITPIKYIPSEGKVSYYKKITVRITTSADETAVAAIKNLQVSNWTIEKVKNLAQNPSEIEAYSSNKSRTTTQYNMLIITTQAYVDGFADLVDLYLHRGIKAQIATKETIIAEGTGADDQDKIRNFIKQEYQTNGVEFVLLGGDVELIPFRGFYCHVVSGSGYTDYGIPSDLYYSALDGNWNTNNDDKWGEADEDDLLPEIAVARFPFSDAAELENMIHKSDFYQNQPVLGEFTSPLLAGEWLYDAPETWGSDYLNLLIGDQTENGYTTSGIPATNNIETMYEEDNSWSGQDLINAINTGKQFVHHVGHANQTYVAYLSNGDITNANFSGANGTNHNYTFLQTHGCDCGAFEYNDCILEKMVTIDNFAVAVIGNSRSGWFNEGQTEGPAAHLHREMVDAMYNDKLSFLGKCFTESKIQTAPWVEAAGQWEEGALRWNFYDLNILGDPTLRMWTAEPIDLTVGYLSELPIGAASTIVNVISNGEPLVNFNCSILLNGEIIAQGFTDANGNVTLTFDPVVQEVCTASLQVVGNNALPAYYTINFIPDAGAYVVYDSNIINDAAGNGNGLADYNEAILLTVNVKNVGSETGFNVTATLSTNDEYAVITDGFGEVPEIPASQTQSLVDAFRFELAGNVPDMHPIEFMLTCTNGTDIWVSNFTITAHAPSLAVGLMQIDDAAGGNGNGLLDPGETVTIAIPCTNVGSSIAVACTARLTEENPFISIDQILVELAQLAPQESKIASYQVTVSPETPIGSVIQFLMRLAGESCVTEEALFANVGLMIENFETGDFSAFEWHHEGNANWIITDNAPFEGVYSAKSGLISDSQQSKLWISLIAVGDDVVTFQRKVSSESAYDYLRFYIDDVKVGEWSGEVPWSQVSFPVTEGSHTLLWAYEKDASVANGSDCAWIDEIVFPTTTTVIGIGEGVITSNTVIYPNPNEGNFTINLGNHLKSNTISIYNPIGKLVYSTTTTQQIIKVNLAELSAGIYILETNADGAKSYSKFVVR